VVIFNGFLALGGGLRPGGDTVTLLVRHVEAHEGVAVEQRMKEKTYLRRSSGLPRQSVDHL